MSITVKTKEFARELAWVSRLSEHKGKTIPILTTTLFETVDGVLRLTSTDLEIGGITEIAAKGSLENKATFPTGKLIAYLKRIDEPEVTLSIVENGFTLELINGNSSVTIQGMNSDRFPELPKPSYQGRLFGMKKALPRVISSISEQLSRFTLSGALLDVREDEARFVSTDGHRLTVLTGRCKTKSAFRVMIPQATLLELKNLDQDWLLFGADENHVFFYVPGSPRRIVSRKLTGAFPDYERVLPTCPHSVTVDAATLTEAVRRVSIFTDKRSGCMEYTFGQKAITLFGEVKEQGAASVDVPCVWNSVFPAESLTINCRWSYVMDFLKLASGEIKINFTDDHSAVEFLFDGWRYVVMPMRRP